MENAELIGTVPLEVIAAARHVAREEIASLCGLVMRRAQEIGKDVGDNVLVSRTDLERIFGEALAGFSGHTHGQQPGE